MVERRDSSGSISAARADPDTGNPDPETSVSVLMGAVVDLTVEQAAVNITTAANNKRALQRLARTAGLMIIPRTLPKFLLAATSYVKYSQSDKLVLMEPVDRNCPASDVRMLICIDLPQFR